MKKWLSLLLCAVLVSASAAAFTSCGGNGGTQSDENTFVEDEVRMPKGAEAVLDVTPMADGTWGALCFNKTKTEGSVWRSGDQGKNWTKSFVFTDNLPMKKISPSKTQWCSALSPTGEIFIFAEKWDDEKSTQYSYLVSDAGKAVRELKLKISPFTTDFAQDGALLIRTVDGSGIQKIDKKTGISTMNFSPEEDKGSQINGFCTYDGILYVFTNKTIYGYSLETGEEQQVDQSIQKAAKQIDNSENFEPSNGQKYLITKDKEGEFQLYVMDDKGINLYTKGERRLLIDGKETCMYTSSNILYALEKIDETHLLAAAYDDEDGLFSYVYRPDKSKEKEELTLYTLSENRDFNNAIGRYQRKHPNITITVTTGVTEDNGVTYSDAIKTLNADLLAGNGPDLICLNEMPVKNFLENGLLEDLTGLIQKADEKEGLLRNVTDSYKKDGKICAVPTQFALTAIEGDPKAVKAAGNLKQLTDSLAELSKDKHTLSGYSFNENVISLYRSFLTPEIAANGTLEKSQLREFYEQIHRIRGLCDEKQLAEAEKDMPLTKMKLEPTSFTEVSRILDYDFPAQVNDLTEVGDFQDLLALQQQKKMDYSLLGPVGNDLFVPQHILGINEKSEKKEQAEAFIAFMLTEKAQVCYYFPGTHSCLPVLPVNRKLLDEDVKNTGGGEIGEGAKKIAVPALDTAQKKEVMKVLQSAKTPADTDGILKEIVFEQLDSYLKGNQNLDQAADQAMKKIQLYLAE